MSAEEAKKFLFNFAVGGTAAAFSKTVTAPFDRTKLVLQNQEAALQILTGERKPYKGIIDCLIRIPQEQGFFSLWRGNGTNLIRYFPMQALNFSFYGLFKDIFHHLLGTESQNVAMLTKFLSGGLAGMSACSLLYPLEFCQTRIAVDVGADKKHQIGDKLVKREFNGLFHCIGQVSGRVGIRGLYGGYGIAVIGIGTYRSVYFGLFDSIKHLWAALPVGEADAPKPPFLIAMAMAQYATCTAGLLAYPLDTVARRLMLDTARPKELKFFKSNTDAFIKIYQTSGIKGFFKGAFTNCLRGTGSAMVLVIYDEVLHYTRFKKCITTCDP